MTVIAMTTSDGALTRPAETAVSPITRPPTMLTELLRDFGTRRPASRISSYMKYSKIASIMTGNGVWLSASATFSSSVSGRSSGLCVATPT